MTPLLVASATLHLLLPVAMGQTLCSNLQLGLDLDTAINRTVALHRHQIQSVDPAMARNVAVLAVDSSVEQCPATWQRMRNRSHFSL